MSKKLFSVASLLVIASMLFAACAAPAAPSTPAAPVVQTVIVKGTPETIILTPTPQPAAPAAPAKKVLQYTAGFGSGDVPTLDPSLTEDTTSVQIVEEMTVGLTRANEETNVPEPGLATKWDISADGTEYTFHLRDDVPWVKWDNAKGEVVKVQDCDGKDRMVKAQDVAYGFLRTLNPTTASPYAYVLNFVLEGGEDYNTGVVTDTAKVGVKVVDDKTLVLKFKQPAAYNANIAGMWVGRAEPSWLIDGDDCTQAKGDRWTETGAYQGYGPYTLKEWVHDSTISIVKNPFWPGSDNIPQPKIEEIVFHMLDSDPGFAEYEAGNMDVASVPLSQIDRAKTDPTLSAELKIAPDLCTYYYGFNNKAPIVDDVRVRRALSMAIDRQSLIDNVTKGGQEPAQWFARPGLAGAPTMADHPDLGIKFDAAKAKEELDAYLKEKNLTVDKLDLTLMFNTSSGHQKIAEAIQQMWKQNLGLDVKLANQEWKVYLNTIKDPKNTPQIWRIGWCADYPDANNFDREDVAFGGSANLTNGGGLNWKDDAYEKLILDAGKELDPQKRVDLYAQAEDILVNKDAAIIPIYWYTRNTETKPYITRTFASTGGGEHFEKWDMDMAAKGK